MDIYRGPDGAEYATGSAIARAAGTSRQAAAGYLKNVPCYRHPENKRAALYPLQHPAVVSYLAGTPHQKDRRNKPPRIYR
jgi:hypothetical protein